MKRLVSIAVLFLSLGSAAAPVAARAQALQRGPVTQGGVTPGDMSRRLDRLAGAVSKQGRTLDRAIEADICYPQDKAEFQRLGGAAIVLLSAVARNETDLPLLRAYVEANGAQIALTPLGAVRQDASNSALTKRVVGAFREDRFYLAPVSALSQEGFALVDWASGRTAFRFYRLPSRPPAWLRAEKAADGAQADPAAVAAVMKREYPGFDIR